MSHGYFDVKHYQQLQVRNQELAESNKRYASQIQQLTSQLQEMTVQNRSLTDRLQANDDIVAGVNKLNHRLSKQNKQLQDHEAALLEENSDLIDEKADLAEENRKSQEYVASLIQELNQVKAANASLFSYADSLSFGMQYAKYELLGLRQWFHCTQDQHGQLQRLQQGYDELLQAHLTLRAQSSAQDDEILRLRQANSGLRAQVRSLRGRVFVSSIHPSVLHLHTVGALPGFRDFCAGQATALAAEVDQIRDELLDAAAELAEEQEGQAIALVAEVDPILEIAAELAEEQEGQAIALVAEVDPILEIAAELAEEQEGQATALVAEVDPILEIAAELAEEQEGQATALVAEVNQIRNEILEVSAELTKLVALEIQNETIRIDLEIFETECALLEERFKLEAPVFSTSLLPIRATVLVYVDFSPRELACVAGKAAHVEDVAARKAPAKKAAKKQKREEEKARIEQEESLLREMAVANRFDRLLRKIRELWENRKRAAMEGFKRARTAVHTFGRLTFLLSKKSGPGAALMEKTRQRKQRMVIIAGATPVSTPSMTSFLQKFQTLADEFAYLSEADCRADVTDIMLHVFVFERSLGYACVEPVGNGKRCCLRVLFKDAGVVALSEPLSAAQILTLVAKDQFLKLIQSYRSELTYFKPSDRAAYEDVARAAHVTVARLCKEESKLFLEDLHCLPVSQQRDADWIGGPRYSLDIPKLDGTRTLKKFTALHLVVAFYTGILQDYSAMLLTNQAHDRDSIMSLVRSYDGLLAETEAFGF